MKGRKDHDEKRRSTGGGYKRGGHVKDHHKGKEHKAGGGMIGGIPESGGHPEKPKENRPERKRGGRVHGKHPGHRLDKRARGGKMTPSSPLSPAGNMSQQSYTKGQAASVSRGEGKDRD